MDLTEEDFAQLMARPADALDALDRIDCEESLLGYMKRFWHVLEPGRPLSVKWPLEAICEHLQAVTEGEIKRLLITVPPGWAKSITTDAFWPSWEWGPRNMPSMRYVAFSYSSLLTLRDNGRFKSLILSHDYARLFGNRFALMKTGEELISNDKTGWKLASSVGGVSTGARGDRIVLDDAHNIKEGESEAVRLATTTWFKESLQNRVNDENSAIVVIMQRVNQEDVAGVILSEMANEYEHLSIPYEWEGKRLISTVPNMVWNEDPRTELGEEAWPERLPLSWRSMKTALGPFAVAAQYQQRPSPRGGGIFKRDWWQLWDPPPDSTGSMRFPQCDYILASLDGAFGQKQENDWSALTVWGVFREQVDVIPGATFNRRQQARQGRPKIILMRAWRRRLPLNGLEIERLEDESEAQWEKRAQPDWGIVQWTMHTCRRLRVDRLIIEAKANGIDVANEIQRQMLDEAFGVELIDPGRLDNVARAYAVQHLLADSMVYAPDRPWADDVIDEMENFPKGGHDDFVDSAVMGWKYLRDIGLAVHGHEIERDFAEQMAHKPANETPLYPA